MEDIFNLIVPSKKEEEELKKVSENFIKKIKIKDTTVVLGGSGAKGTWLKGDHDIDIYVKFNYAKYKDKSDEISKILEKTLKKKFKKITKLHGSRDYFQIQYEKFNFEIVPILNIKKAEEAKNITDISQLHVKYVQQFPKLQNEIRLVKKFCKANRVYGAESYIKGFSGYVVELLVIHYGSFLNFVDKVKKWKPEVLIGSKKEYNKLNKSKREGPLIIIDPVQPGRNAAAAVSDKIFYRLIKACEDYSKTPSNSFFEEKPFNIESLKKKAKNKKLVLMQTEFLKGKNDIVGAKLVKALEFIVKHVRLEGFSVYEADWIEEKGKIKFWLIADPKPLSNEIKLEGPPLRLEDQCKKFKKAHKGKTIIEEQGKTFVIIKRKYTEIEDFLKKDLFKDKEHILKRVKSIKITPLK